jgi:hypothetical protein
MNPQRPITPLDERATPRDRAAPTEPDLSDDGYGSGVQTLPPTHGEALADEASDEHGTPYLPDQTSSQAGDRWQRIQAQFVDDPRKAVGQAHELVGELVQQIIDGFSRERDTLEQQWSKGDSVSTEDLRVALQSYRAFFSRLLPSARASLDRG